MKPVSNDLMYEWVLLTTGKQGFESQNIFVDYIELNSRMGEPFPVILKYNENFIQFSYFSLYAVACPIASITVLIYNLI